MKKIMLVGRSEAGKTTLTNALLGKEKQYHKTQYINYHDAIIDTPGEYVQLGHLGRAIALYAYEAEVVGLLAAANEPYSLYPPCITCLTNRETIGIVTKINKPNANIERAELWLQNAGCRKIFLVDSVSGEGMDELIRFLNEK